LIEGPSRNATKTGTLSLYSSSEIGNQDFQNDGHNYENIIPSSSIPQIQGCHKANALAAERNGQPVKNNL
jgi:hypothetical protein